MFEYPIKNRSSLLLLLRPVISPLSSREWKDEKYYNQFPGVEEWKDGTKEV